jgi:hypothetical protein
LHFPLAADPRFPFAPLAMKRTTTTTTTPAPRYILEMSTTDGRTLYLCKVYSSTGITCDFLESPRKNALPLELAEANRIASIHKAFTPSKVEIISA